MCDTFVLGVCIWFAWYAPLCSRLMALWCSWLVCGVLVCCVLGLIVLAMGGLLLIYFACCAV